MEIFQQVRPNHLISDTKKCNFILPEKLDGWMAEQVLIPMSKQGIQELTFTIPENTPVHLSIASSFAKAQSILNTSYFSTIDEALFHHKPFNSSVIQNNSAQFNCQLNPTTDTLDIQLNLPFNELPQFLTSLKQIEQDKRFIETHQAQFYSLTPREKQIFTCIALGKTNKQIAYELFIEESSVKTHRKNIKRKLQIVSHYDIYQYARCFHVI